MLFKIKHLYILLIFNTLFLSCDFLDNETFDPAFIYLHDPSLATISGQGETTLKVEEVYVYQDGILRGVFPINSKVPLLINTTSSVVRIAAAIRVNGQKSTSVEYPFFQPIEVTLDLEAGKIFDQALQFTYVSTAKFDFIEGFEAGNIFNIDLDEDTNTSVTTTTEDFISGNKSGLFRGSLQRLTTEVTHSTVIPRSNNSGGRVFLEMDYKSQDPISIGTILYSKLSTAKEYKVILTPKEEWNKIYIDLTDEISSNTIEGYKIALLSYYEGSSLETASFIDNIKLVHF